MTTERAPVVSAETPDQRLHQDLLAQAPGAVEALVHRYGVKIYRLALRITGSPEDAQEVSQDVLWTIVRKIGTFKGESALGSWIYRITANAAYEKLRSRRGKDEVSWEALLPAFDRDGHLVEPGHDWTQQTEDPALQRSPATAAHAIEASRRTTGRVRLHDMEGSRTGDPEISRSGRRRQVARERSRLFLRQAGAVLRHGCRGLDGRAGTRGVRARATEPRRHSREHRERGVQPTTAGGSCPPGPLPRPGETSRGSAGPRGARGKGRDASCQPSPKIRRSNAVTAEPRQSTPAPRTGGR